MKNLNEVQLHESLKKRFLSSFRLDINTDCWIWTAGILNTGYGTISSLKRRILAHRASYEIIIGKIPKGLVIDHLCKNKLCVNPKHLEAVTQKENINRGICHNKEKTCCPKGHLYDRQSSDGKKRYCSQCYRVYLKQWRKEQKGAGALCG